MQTAFQQYFGLRSLTFDGELVAAVNIVPFTESIDIFVKEKVRLMSQGTPIDDFDLLIGAVAVQQDLILETDNVKHFKNIQGLTIT